MARQITIDKLSSGLWTATFNNPPINLIDPDTIGELQDLLAELESDAEIKVVVFRARTRISSWRIGMCSRTSGKSPPCRRVPRACIPGSTCSFGCHVRR